MKIAVVGAGGVGGYYGALLARAGHEVHFIARGAHLQAMREEGLKIVSPFGDFVVQPALATDDPASVGPVDLILFCTKTYSTEAAALAARPMVGPDTTVLGLQNGVEALDQLGQVLGKEHVLLGVTWLSSARLEPGVIQHKSDFRRVAMGEPDGRITTRLQSVQSAFLETGVITEVSQDIAAVLWTKLTFIAAASAFGSLTRLPMSAYRAVPETRRLILGMMQETAAVANALGHRLAADVVERSIAQMDAVGPTIKASMQLDVEAGRVSELDSMVGVIGRKGAEAGVPTPIADMLYALLLPGEKLARAAST